MRDYSANGAVAGAVLHVAIQSKVSQLYYYIGQPDNYFSTFFFSNFVDGYNLILVGNEYFFFEVQIKFKINSFKYSNSKNNFFISIFILSEYLNQISKIKKTKTNQQTRTKRQPTKPRPDLFRLKNVWSRRDDLPFWDFCRPCLIFPNFVWFY